MSISIAPIKRCVLLIEKDTVKNTATLRQSDEKFQSLGQVFVVGCDERVFHLTMSTISYGVRSST